jgi:hypothetical protein
MGLHFQKPVQEIRPPNSGHLLAWFSLVSNSPTELHCLGPVREIRPWNAHYQQALFPKLALAAVAPGSPHPNASRTQGHHCLVDTHGYTMPGAYHHTPK